MPTYDLRCPSCGLHFEVFRQHFLRAEDRVCVGCGAPGAIQRLTGFITSPPARDDPTPSVTGFAQHTCHAGCSHARTTRSGEIVPP